LDGLGKMDVLFANQISQTMRNCQCSLYRR
jgi:hypothetical protein